MVVYSVIPDNTWRTRWGSNPQGVLPRRIKSPVSQPIAQRVHVDEQVFAEDVFPALPAELPSVKMVGGVGIEPTTRGVSSDNLQLSARQSR